ncbi:raffinose synthase Sip1 [Stachybotrys elegans]|uniref:Raffinose synthase Sip1 n=1 Tax=Stachybotrys elegans TaxID=80388 RepID=A0A8K0WRH9_9HYPO|nr:raffinose synthase Sip1 [Stachybotrys elegans]
MRIQIDQNNPAVTAQIQSYPPLGEVTPIPGSSATFTIVLIVPEFSGKQRWEVALWKSVDEGEWSEVIAASVAEDKAPVDLGSPSSSPRRHNFTAAVFFKAAIKFTLKFRPAGDSAWRWVRDELGLGDGLVISPPAPEYPPLAELIADLNPLWKVSKCASESPRTSLWSIEAKAAPAVDDKPGITDLEIGTPWGSCVRWFALIRQSAAWIAPRQGKDKFFLDKDAILCSFLSHKGQHIAILALSGSNEVLTVLRSTSRGSLSARATNDGIGEEKCTVFISVGNEFENAVASVMFQARKSAWSSGMSQTEYDNPADAADEVNPAWMENWYDGLGFCTWNALGKSLTDDKIYNALEALAKHDIKVSNLIIDDNWQSLEIKGESRFQDRWTDFEADPNTFPKGLKVTVATIRQRYPWIKHVAVWHALLGYWGGISTKGAIAEKYKTVEVPLSHHTGLPLDDRMVVVAKEDVGRLYSDFYNFLANAGIDSIKTDAQCMVDLWDSASARRELTKTYLNAWALSALRHFGAKAISCMSQVPQIIFYSQLPTSRPAIIVRNSEDFFPGDPSSHLWHLWTNAHNSIFSQYLNALPDWDMFQTIHEYSHCHAAARCVSGGPVYITDVPGRHNLDLIKQMTGTTTRGNTVVFRPSTLGKSIHPYTGFDDGLLLKIGGYHGLSGRGTSILAVFNISTRPVLEVLPLASFPGTLQEGQYVIRAHRTGRVSPPSIIGSPKSLLAASINVRSYEMFWASPLVTLKGTKSNRDILVAALGLLGKMTGCAAIASSSVKKLDNGRNLIVTRVKALGTLGLYISMLPELTIDDHFMITIQGKPIPVETVAMSKDDEHVLEIDIERAWKEMGLSSGWSNEVEVMTYFSA